MSFPKSYAHTFWLSAMFLVTNAVVNINIVSLRFANTSSNPIRTIVEPLLDCAMDDLRERNSQSLIRYTHTNIFQPDHRPGDCSSVADDSQYLLSRWYYARGQADNMQTNIFVWPNCLEAPFVENLASLWNVLFVTSSGEGAPTLTDRQRGSTWITTYFGCANYPELYSSLFTKYGWRKIFVLIWSNAALQRYKGCALLFIRYMKQYPRIRLYVTEVQGTKVDYDKILWAFNSSSRIFAYFGLNAHLRQLLVRATISNMTTGEHVYLAMEPVRDASVYGHLNWKYNLTDDEVAMTGFRSLLILEPKSPPAAALQHGVEVVQRSRRRMGILKPVLLREISVQVPMTAYDVVFVVDQVIREFTQNGTCPLEEGGRSLVPLFLNRTFGVPSGTVSIDALGRRTLDLVITRFQPPDMDVREVLFDQPGLSLELHQTANFSWYGTEEMPSDTPFCGFDGLSAVCRKSTSLTPAIGICSAILLCILDNVSLSPFWGTRLVVPGPRHPPPEKKTSVCFHLATSTGADRTYIISSSPSFRLKYSETPDYSISPVYWNNH